jgi:hypothetical protein
LPSFPQIWDLDFLAANAQRKYPLADEATRFDVSGSVQLPNDFLVDAVVPVNYDTGLNPALFHILSVSVFGSGVTVTLGYNGTAIGTATIDAGSFTRNSTYIVPCVGSFFDTVARLVVGSLDSIRKSPGSFTFDLIGARLSPSVIRPDIRGVDAIYLKNGTEVQGPLTGDIVFEAGTNMLLTFTAGDGSPGNPDRITLSAIDGEGLNNACGCSESQDLPCVKTINGILPDMAGNFEMLDDDCVKLQGIANGLQLTEVCAKPCCDCKDLDAIQQTLERVTAQINGLENLATRLETAIGTLNSNVLFTHV